MSERPEACAEQIIRQLATSIALSERLHEVGDEVHARINAVVRLEKKGAHKTAEDLVQIRALKREIRELLQAGLPEGVTAEDPIILSMDETPIQQDGPDKFYDIESDSETFVRAHAPMFLTPWSNQFVHGPDVIIHPVILAEAHLLKPGERICELRTVTWRKPIQHDLDLAVYARAFEKRPTGSDPYALHGEFGTSDGRILTFMGIEKPDQPISKMADCNPYAKMVFCGCESCHKKNGADVHAFRLKKDVPPDTLEVLRESTAFRIATLLEILTYALLVAGTKRGYDGEVIAHSGLMSRVTNLPIPEGMEDILGGKKSLQLRNLGKRTVNRESGLSMMPFEYRFPHQSEFSRGIVAVNDGEKI